MPGIPSAYVERSPEPPESPQRALERPVAYPERPVASPEGVDTCGALRGPSEPPQAV